jgi:peptidyl-prolyl cis-trans isomerase B (cyclophilin B)
MVSFLMGRVGLNRRSNSEFTETRLGLNSEPMSESNGPATGEEVAIMQTNLGTIKLKFFPDKAPKHVANFKKLAREGFYDGTKFHRVIPGFMIQGGDPNSKSDDRSRHGTGGPGYSVPAEFNDTPHTRGILSAARSSDPDSAGSQFFLMVARSPHLDGQYTAYGEVIEGMDVIDKIVALPRDVRDNPKPENPAIIEKVTIE